MSSPQELLGSSVERDFGGGYGSSANTCHITSTLRFDKNQRHDFMIFDF
jgi:hypothetical protein